MDLFARNDGEHYVCGLIDGPCQMEGLDRFVQDPAHGAIAQFFGVVRNHNEGLSAEAVDYDVHPELGAEGLGRIVPRIVYELPSETGDDSLTWSCSCG